MKFCFRELSSPTIVAELSGNHNQSLERGLAIVEAAATAGVHAIKLQTYTADTMTLDIDHNEFVINDQESLWNGKSLYRLYQQAYTPWEWHERLFKRARDLGLIAFSTPFDETAVDFLEKLDAPCYKIASFENTDIPLIRKVAATGKPVIISSGMATIEELDEAVTAAREMGCKDLMLLKCTSSYPASPENTNILTIPHMRERYGCEVGLSDHTMGIGVAVASVSLGSKLIEKHFTLKRSDGGVDATFSLEPDEMALLVKECKRAWQALGHITYGTSGEEERSKQFRRSIYVVENIRAGESFTKSNIRCIRPGFGLPPKFYDQIIGQPAVRSLKRGTPLSWSALRIGKGEL